MNNDFQTPPEVAQYMCSLIPPGTKTVLEPTPGLGNILNCLTKGEYVITAPIDFFTMRFQKFDCIIMNPPFSLKSAFGVPKHLDLKGMRLGYYILNECMRMSDNVIALMTWFTITDSDVRLRYLKDFGLKSITSLPRKTFEYSRIQTCILELDRNYNGETIFRMYGIT